MNANLQLTLAFVSTAYALLYGIRFVDLRPSLRRSVIKAIPVTALAVLSAFAGGPIALTCALAFGALGDVFLSRDGERNFLLGLGAFLVGHLCYVLVLANAGGGFGGVAEDLWRLALGLALLVFAVGVLRHIRPHLGAMRSPVYVYVAVIAAMGLAATALPLGWPIGLALPGALLFIASDAILSHEVFVAGAGGPKPRWRGPTIWFLYWGGQALICAAFLL